MMVGKQEQELVSDTLFFAASVYVSAQAQIASIMPLSDFTEDSDAVFLLTSTIRGSDNYLTHLNISTSMMANANNARIANIEQTVLLLAIGSTILIAFALWIILRPRQYCRLLALYNIY
jgi:hypothetical protein